MVSYGCVALDEVIVVDIERVMCCIMSRKRSYRVNYSLIFGYINSLVIEVLEIILRYNSRVICVDFCVYLLYLVLLCFKESSLEVVIHRCHGAVSGKGSRRSL